jgi:exopolysaccharide biosynthesis polyprenyl glycosylphosphotransferase
VGDKVSDVPATATNRLNAAVEPVGRAQTFQRARDDDRWKDALRRRMLAAADLIAVLVVTATVGALEGADAALVMSALIPLWLLLAKLHGLYDRDHVKIRHLTVDELPSLMYWTILSVAVSCLVLSLLPGLTLDGPLALAMWSVGVSTSFALRGLARLVWRHAVPPERTLVLGEGPLADAVHRKLVLERGHHVEVVDPPERAAPSLADRVVDLGISRIVVAQHDLDESALSHIVGTCRTHNIRLSVAPPLQAMFGTAVDLNHLAELPVVEFRTWDPSRSTMFLKRAMDVTVASIGLVLGAPVLALVAIAVRLDSKGPALFRQVRAGREGRPFTMLKFRTMVADAEDRLQELVPLASLAEPMFKLRADPRVTRLGRVLRRTSFDELPQLWNVLKGEMSLVGPRPEELRLVERYRENEQIRLEMRPGITGPMQVHGRGDLTFAERLAIEREYIENYNLRKDLTILLETIVAIVRGQGAY